MLWNFMMHALMGWLGADFFIPTPERIGIAILVVCVTQGADQYRLRKELWAEVATLPEDEQGAATSELEKNMNRILATAFVKNTLIFLAILLFTAHAVRLNG